MSLRQKKSTKYSYSTVLIFGLNWQTCMRCKVKLCVTYKLTGEKGKLMCLNGLDSD